MILYYFIWLCRKMKKCKMVLLTQFLEIFQQFYILLKREGDGPTETINNLYGSRYVEDSRHEMEKLLFSYNSFEQYMPNHEKIKKHFPKECFISENTLEFISTCVFSLKHSQHLIIAGNSGIGKKNQLGNQEIIIMFIQLKKIEIKMNVYQI